MGYLHINNLYKDQTVLIFKECYALEKIHGTSAHIRWDGNKVNFFSGGETHSRFVALFDTEFLTQKLTEMFGESDVYIYGEAYGGKQQGMSQTYGKELKFIGFDVKVNGMWLEVPNAEGVCNSLGVEFVDYVKVPTDVDVLNFERDKPSTQAIRNGCGERPREGVILRPLIEFTSKNGDRIISKHKGESFQETKTKREVAPGDFEKLTEARAIAEEWVTEMRLTHVLDKFPQASMEDTRQVIASMGEDVYREAKGEIEESKEATKAISNRTVLLFKQRLQKILENKDVD
jgi:hypothetical protein